MNISRRIIFGICVLTLAQTGAIGQSYGVQTIAGTTVIKDGISASTAFLREPIGVVADSAGNIYLADRSDNRVRRIDAKTGLISTVAGTGFPGHAGDSGPATLAQLNAPFQLALDKTNNLYIAEYLGNSVRKLNFSSGILTTVAGTGGLKVTPGDGVKATQTVIDPEGIAVDSKGNLLISDGMNHKIRRVTGDGSITTIGGTGVCNDSGDNGPATAAQMCFPTEMGVDSADNIYFIDYYNTRVRKIDGKTGVISAYLGDGYPLDWNDGFLPGETSVYYPDGLGVDAAGNLYVSENSRIRLVPAAGGTVRTVAGNATLGFAGDKGAAVGAKLAFPAGIFAFANGDLLLADTGNFRLRRVTGGTIDTIAGITITDGVSALFSVFNGPHGMAEDSAGNIYIADTFNHRIRLLTASTGTVSTVAGTGTAGSLEGRINGPDDVAIDSKGVVYFSDTGNSRILRLQADGTTKVYAGSGVGGYSGDGSFANNARLSSPKMLAFDKADTLYFTDYDNNRIRKVTTDGLIQLVAGNGNTTYSGDGGNARNAGMNPSGIAVDVDGTIYFSDYGNSRVRKIDASGTVTTVAGSGTFGSAGDAGKATDAYLSLPNGLALDAGHNLLITDQYASVVRRVNLTTGIITTIAGSGKPYFVSESGAASLTNLDPTEMFVEKNGTILLSDSLNDRVRRLTPLVARNMTMSAGDKGSGVTGTSLAIAVKVSDSNAYPVQGQAVSFTVTAGKATLVNPTVVSGVDGVATAQVTLAAVPGVVTVRADSTGLPSVTFTLTATAPVTVPPVISGVNGAPQSVPPVTTVSRNATALVLLSGTSGTLAAPPVTPYPVVLNNYCVTVGGTAAPVFSATAQSIGIIVPDVPAGAADVVVTVACGTGQDAASAPFSVTVAATSPEFNYVNPMFYVAAVVAGIASGTPDVPVHQGDSVSISVVGLGATNPVEPIGDVPADMAAVTGTVTLTLGGNPVTPDFVGLMPGDAPGVYRVNLTLPMDAPLGDQPLTIQVGDAVSPAGVLNIAPPVSQLSRDGRRIERNDNRKAFPSIQRK